MELEGEIAEALCEVAEEVPWHKVLTEGRATVTKLSQEIAGSRMPALLCRKADITQTSEGRMEGFTEKDAQNLQLAKEVVGGLASAGDAAAAAAFARLLDAETRREELRLKTVGRDTAPAAAPDSSWQETVRADRQSAEPSLSAVA